nr:MAG TPA: hypothetical protein [Caudoviricetes sp.]
MRKFGATKPKKPHPIYKHYKHYIIWENNIK